MKNETNQQRQSHRKNERGSAGVKFLLVFVALILAINAGYNYIPVAYEGADLKQEMETAVVQSMALPGSSDPVAITKARLQRVIVVNDIPRNALVEVKQVNNLCQARIAYAQSVKILPFGLYNYIYQFDHTATPTGFLAKSKT